MCSVTSLPPLRLDEVTLEAKVLGLLDLKHLLVFLRVLLNLFVEEEIGCPDADAVSLRTVCWVLLLQLLEQFVALQAPGLQQPEGDGVRVGATDGWRPFTEGTGNLRSDPVLERSLAFGDRRP